MYTGAFEETAQIHTMGSRFKWFLLILTLIVCSILFRLYKMDTYQFIKSGILEIAQVKTKAASSFSERIVEPGIIFVEATDKVEPSPLAVCSVESAARLNPEKKVYYFMKGLSGKLSQYPHPNYTGIPLLSAISNVVLVPMNVPELFENTPLDKWYQKVNPELEKYWIHVLADGCRIALVWKYGGIYLDTDIISIKPLPIANFTTLEDDTRLGNAAFGFHIKHHQFVLECMKDFVANYIGHIWGQQGPQLITRVLRRWCKFNDTDKLAVEECNGITVCNKRRFAPIPYQNWTRYFDSWKKEDIESVFSGTYGAHVWNYMNTNSGMTRKVIAGSGSLIEHFFQMYCPTTYRSFIQFPKNPESIRT
ncbi:alpha-1,4-N-acetylglucosaminyltransferase-like isoform X3 [Scyliorhinus canicula]|uniref:alpha-1,4-N-acetylglucosaminyltransferase-like isoform X3 n=1 Tax=Scyliorhinus canicula TaxID=7830 RepID=UPI0018F2C9A0|nr:alpha-1,4-N-acetylglucosaminyltransferase-like isoform X3 [Scyliorhinus canicula]